MCIGVEGVELRFQSSHLVSQLNKQVTTQTVSTPGWEVCDISMDYHAVINTLTEEWGVDHWCFLHANPTPVNYVSLRN